MKSDSFKVWLDEKYPSGAGATRFAHAKKVEANYGDLDAQFDLDELDGVLQDLRYNGRDRANDKPNPSKIAFNGDIYNNLASYAAAVRLYRDFRANECDAAPEGAIEIVGEIIRERNNGKQFEVERHLQTELRREIGQLEAGLEIIDQGMERSVESGFIDILARDTAGALVVIELKAGMAKREAVGQITGYMGDLIGEEPDTPVRGILVASDFDKSCQSGIRAIPALKLKRYRFSFTFEDMA